jgi:DMSO reductase family type II enzyme heme b subunit
MTTFKQTVLVIIMPALLGFTADETALENPKLERVQTGSEIYFTNCFYCHGLQGTPWNTAMPDWHDMLDEEQVSNVQTFLYDMQNKTAKMSGKEIYHSRCAVCHGEKGVGDGPAAEFIYPKPRDFSMGTFKYKTSPGDLPPRDEDLFNTIKNGLNGTAMPGWGTLLSDEQIKSLIPVIKGLDTFGTWEPEDDEGQKPINFIRITEIEPIEGQIPYSAESIAKGKIAFEKNCKACHGEVGRGNITSNRPLADDWGYRLWPRDLTKPWTWRFCNVPGNENETIRNIYRIISIGIFGTPMPAHRSTSDDHDPVSLADRWHIANYVYSLRENSIPPSDSAVIKAVRIEGALPTSVDDPAWNKVAGTTLRLLPNLIKDERLFTPLADAITARVLYNAREIAFLLEVNDRTDSRPGETVCEILQDEFLELFSDAFAIQFSKEKTFEMPPVQKPLFGHGDAATIWYWNAGSINPEVAPQSMIFDCKASVLEPRLGDKTLVATGKWEKGCWRVLMKRPRKGGESDVSFTEGQFIPISFANWDGSNSEVGSKHTLTNWSWLLLIQ